MKALANKILKAAGYGVVGFSLKICGQAEHLLVIEVAAITINSSFNIAGLSLLTCSTQVLE